MGQGDWAQELQGHKDSVSCLAFSTDGQLLASGSLDGVVQVWDISSGYPYHTEGLTCLTISSDSALAITGSKDGSVHIVNIIITGKVINSLIAHSDSVECIGLSQSFTPWAATGGMDQKLVIWDLQHSTPRCTCDHKEGVACFAWLGLSRYVATGCVDGKIRVWDGLSGDCVKTFSGHSDAIQSMSVSANMDFLVSVSIDQTARVFEIAELR